VETPHGFSGGGCFIISERPGEVAALGHKLIGIQSSWYRESRLVEVIPIKPWYEMVKAYLASRPKGRFAIPGGAPRRYAAGTIT